MLFVNFVAEVNLIEMAMNKKLYRSILCGWIAALACMALLWCVAVCHSARQGKAAVKEVAKENLCEAVELELDREFERMKIPYSRFFGEKKHTKRLSVTEKGMFEVMIDSVKETQALYSLEVMGAKVDVLFSLDSFPLERIYDNWQERIKNSQNGVSSTLFLKRTPLGEDAAQESYLGDSTICFPQNELGTYYLDCMYTTVLTACLLPAFWQSVDWTSTWVLLLSCVWLILFFSLLVWFMILKLRKRRATGTSVQDTYQIGEYVFNILKHTLTCQGIEKPCSLQNSKLLYAFLTAPDHFLTYDEIAKVCGWSLDSAGLGERRRNAIRNLRELFDNKVDFLSLPGKKACQMVIPKQEHAKG